MEGLILAIIIAIAGSLFSGKNKKKKQDSMPPFNNKPVDPSFQRDIQPEQRQKPRSLEDFAKGVFEQLNEQKQLTDIFGEQPPKVETPKIEPMIEIERVTNKRKPLSENRSADQRQGSTVKTASTRTSQKEINDVINDNEIGQFVPNSRQALMQAIITSEIIGPPKAKQRS